MTDLLTNSAGKASLALLETYAHQTEQVFDQPTPLVEVVRLATGVDMATLPEAKAKKLSSKLDELQIHLTEIGSTVCRQYFHLGWVPRLGSTLAWLIMVLRSKCYFNEDTEELREEYTWHKRELAAVLGQSTDNLSNLLANPYTDHFCNILKQNKRTITIKVKMVYTFAVLTP